VSLDQPLLVVPPPELPEGLDQLGHGRETFDPKQVRFQRADEALRDAIGLRSRMHPIRTISLDVSA
jgi:hypothetical protein